MIGRYIVRVPSSDGEQILNQHRFGFSSSLNIKMKNVKVLIADDHEEFRADLRRFLATQQGIEIIGEAADGVETVSLADRLHPDLILLDINMPRMSGMEVAQYIKEHSPDIKIVMVTIHEEETYQTVADYFGVDGFVSKNSLKQNLLRVLRHVVN